MSGDDVDRFRAIRVKDELTSRYSGIFEVTPAKAPLDGKQVYLWLIAPPPTRSQLESSSSGLSASMTKEERTKIDISGYVWSLVHTFTPTEVGKEVGRIYVSDVVALIDLALSGENPSLLTSLDGAVARAKSRLARKRQY